MERSLLCKTSAANLSPYVQSTKNTHLRGSSRIIQPRNGMIVFDFSQTTADEISLNFKRDSGNGLFVSYISGKGKEHVVTSKTGQRIFFPLDKTKKIHLYRTTRSRGDISFIDLELYEKKEVIDWNECLSKIEEYTCLRLGEKNTLLASEGGVIKTTGKITIKTEPENAFVKTDTGIKFTTSCQILYLNVIDSKETTSKPKLSTAIFDSSISGFNQSYCILADVQNNGVSIGHRGCYEMPLQGIVVGKTYSITISAQLLSGNGKIMFGIVPDNNTSKYNVVRSKTPVEFTTNVTTVTDKCSLKIWRHPSSKGNVLVSKILVQEVGPGNRILPKLPKHIDIQPDITPAKTVKPDPVFVPQPMQDHDASSRVESVSRYFAIFPEPIPVEGANHELTGSVMVSGYTARKWLNWLRVYYPKIAQNAQSRVAVCDVNNIVVAERVWLDAFVGNHKSRVAPLSGSKAIFTPSLPNKIKLKEWLGERANIQVAELPLPKISDANKPGGYFLYFDDTRQYTRHLFRIWNPEYKLHVVGTKERIPPFAKYISEYEQFSSLSDQISNATGLISLTENNHHISALIELALSMGVPVLTNNHQYFGKANVVKHTTDAPMSKTALDTTLNSMKRLSVCDHNNDVIAALKRLGVV